MIYIDVFLWLTVMFGGHRVAEVDDVMHCPALITLF